MSTSKSPPFDPWTAFAGDAFEALESWLSGSLESEKSPLVQYCAAYEVNSLRVQAESDGEGAGFAVLKCVGECLRAQLVAPDWLNQAFQKRFRSVEDRHVGSWDDAFGRPLKKGVHLATARRDKELVPIVMQAVQEARSAGRAVDKELFYELAERLNMQGHKVYANLVSDLYYRTRKTNADPGAMFRDPRAIAAEEDLRAYLSQHPLHDLAPVDRSSSRKYRAALRLEMDRIARQHGIAQDWVKGIFEDLSMDEAAARFGRAEADREGTT